MQNHFCDTTVGAFLYLFNNFFLFELKYDANPTKKLVEITMSRYIY